MLLWRLKNFNSWSDLYVIGIQWFVRLAVGQLGRVAGPKDRRVVGSQDGIILFNLRSKCLVGCRGSGHCMMGRAYYTGLSA
jgi:hypothetical protein